MAEQNWYPRSTRLSASLTVFESSPMHILLALDGSDESKFAVEQLRRLPFATKPTLTFVTALCEASDPAYQEVCQAEKERAQRDIAEATQHLQDCVAEIRSVVRYQHPSSLILEVAEQEASDLIVLGARGHNAVYRVVVGSTAEYVVNHAKSSVLVFRRDSRAHASEDDNWRMLLPYDGSASANVAGSQICALGLAGVDLHLDHHDTRTPQVAA